MRTVRLVVACATAAACVGLGCRALRVAWAEAAYQRGLGYTDDPSRDEPGRLDAYREAVRRRPDEALYLLRVGQISLSRAERANDSAGIRVARGLLEHSVGVQPLDPRSHAVLAGAYLAEGRPTDAIEEARRARRVGPRHPTIQATVLRLSLLAWTQAGQREGLRLALETAADLATWSGRSTPSPAGTQAVLRAGPRAAADVLEVAAGDAHLLSTAAGWFERSDAAMAATLRALASRASHESDEER